MSELKIRTPEGIAFAFPLAGPVTRCLAWLVDLTCIAAIGSLLGTLTKIAGAVNEDMGGALGVLAYFLISIGYGVAAEWYWRGQTVGKRLLRLRVMDERGLRLQFSQILIRNLLRFVDMLPACYLIGGAACFFSKKCQRLGDIAASTVVARNPKIAEPDLDQLALGKFNSLKNHPHLEARLRQRMSPDEARVALQALLRRDEFEPAARVELFGELATHFRGMVNFPPESTDAITDEQYIRNVVDVVFRSRGSEARVRPEPASQLL